MRKGRNKMKKEKSVLLYLLQLQLTLVQVNISQVVAGGFLCEFRGVSKWKKMRLIVFTTTTHSALHEEISQVALEHLRIAVVREEAEHKQLDLRPGTITNKNGLLI